MRAYLEERPVLWFLTQVLGLVGGAGILVVAAGLVFRWTNRIDYSDGFFFASVFYAVVGTVKSYMKPRGVSIQRGGTDPSLPPEPAHWNRLERFLNRRSIDFKLVTAAAICLAVSLLIAEL
jgi:hypothetical protein